MKLYVIGTILCVFGIIVSITMTLYGLWQLDVICKGPVWNQCSQNIGFYQWLLNEGYSRYSDYPFMSSELWITTTGRAYDTLMAIISMAPFILSASLGFLLYNERKEVKKLRKMLNYK